MGDFGEQNGQQHRDMSYLLHVAATRMAKKSPKIPLTYMYV